MVEIKEEVVDFTKVVEEVKPEKVETPKEEKKSAPKKTRFIKVDNGRFGIVRLRNPETKEVIKVKKELLQLEGNSYFDLTDDEVKKLKG